MRPWTILCSWVTCVGLVGQGCGDDGGADGSEFGTTIASTTITSSTSGGGTDSAGDADTSGTASDGSSTFTGSTSTSGTGSTSGGDNCGELDFEFSPTPPNVMLVLDKSGSMMDEWQYQGMNVSRWYTLYDVVQQMVTALDSTVRFGMKLFPSAGITDNDGDACDVDPIEVPVAVMNAAPIMSAMPDQDGEVAGRTPTRVGFELSVDHLKSLDPINPPVVILVTDGAANCADGNNDNDYDDALNDAVEEAFTADAIPTYVVGIGIDEGEDVYDELNDVAVKGGVPKTDPNDPNERFYNAADGDALQLILEEISGSLASCVVRLDPQPPNPAYVTVSVGGMVIPQVGNCTTEHGWQYTNPNGPYDALRLCGTACEQLELTGTLDVIYGCPPAE